ncbi:MAG TPA: transposase [Gemmataceae bacterium]|nr:transposase [Gemmataceae bacterium]
MLPPDQIIACKPSCCKYCGYALCGDNLQPHRHPVLELPPIHPEVTEYQVHRLHCSRCGHRTSWAHLRRDFQAMIDRNNAGTKIGEDLLFLSDVMFDTWHRVRDGTLQRKTLSYRTENWYRPHVRQTLEAGRVCGCAKTEATCRELLALEPAFWTFARVEGIKPTNNAAEQLQRHPAQWRKTSYGSDSVAGGCFVANILSLVATFRQQGKKVLDVLTACSQAVLTGTPPPSLLPQATS